MLQYDRTNVREGSDINETSKSKKCMLSHYWYFKDVGSNFNCIFVMVVMLSQ